MFESVVIRLRRGFGNAFAAALVASLALATSVSAQTTVVLNQAGSQVTDTTIQSGSSSNTNFDGGVLITRRSDDPDWQRRAILKFDTQNFIPQGAQIASATLTLTVKSGLGSGGQTRPLEAWRLASAFQEGEATWMLRQGTSSWSTPGGDLGEVVGSANATNTAGGKVNINVTSLVQKTSDGDFGSRYTRILTIEDGLIGTVDAGLRGFAAYAAGKFAGRGVRVEHCGIVDPSVAPSETFQEVWAHFGMTAEALTERLAK